MSWVLFCVDTLVKKQSMMKIPGFSMGLESRMMFRSTVKLYTWSIDVWKIKVHYLVNVVSSNACLDGIHSLLSLYSY